MGTSPEDTTSLLSALSKACIRVKSCQPFSFDGQRGNGLGSGCFVSPNQFATVKHVLGTAPSTITAVLSDGRKFTVTGVEDSSYRDWAVCTVSETYDGYFEAMDSTTPDLGEVLVAGNDAGEKFSVTEATISRTDCNPPDYDDGWVDFQTQYYQIASPLSGGSSGSPVLRHGKITALVVSGRSDATTRWLIPIGEAAAVVRGQAPKSYGHLGVRWKLEPFGKWQNRLANFPDKPDYILRAEKVLTFEGEKSKFKVNDVLVCIDNQRIKDFTSLNDHLRVGQKVDCQVFRQGEKLEFESEVLSLEDSVPKDFLFLEGFGCVQPCMLAQVLPENRQRPLGGLFLFDCMDPILNGRVLVGLSLGDFKAMIKAGHHRIPVKWQEVESSDSQVRHDSIDMKNVTAFWECRKLESGLWDYSRTALTKPQLPMDRIHANNGRIWPIRANSVLVTCSSSQPVYDGIPMKHGNGTIVQPGLVLTSAAIVPWHGCRVTLEFDQGVVYGESIETTPSGVVAIRYNTKDLQSSTSPLQFTQSTFRLLWAKDDNGINCPVWRDKRPVFLEYHRPWPSPLLPNFFSLGSFPVGFVTDILQRKVVGIGMDLFLGGDDEENVCIPGANIKSIISTINDSEQGYLLVCLAEVESNKLALRLPGPWATKRCHPFDARKYFTVRFAHPRTKLLPGDLVVAIGGKCPGLVLDICQDKTIYTVIREGKEVPVEVRTFKLDELSNKEMFNFHGLVVQQILPQFEVNSKKTLRGLHVSVITEGSPARFWNIHVESYITEIDGQQMNTIDDIQTAAQRLVDERKTEILIGIEEKTGQPAERLVKLNGTLPSVRMTLKNDKVELNYVPSTSPS